MKLCLLLAVLVSAVLSAGCYLEVWEDGSIMVCRDDVPRIGKVCSRYGYLPPKG